MVTRTLIGQAAAALGVITSLGLVAYEVRQNTKAVTGQTMQALAQQHADLALFGVENADLRAAFDGSFPDMSRLTPDEVSLLNWYYTAVMRVTENRFRQYQVHTLSEEALTQFGAEGSLFRSPFFKAWWPENSYQFSEDFASWVEGTLLPLETRPLWEIGG